MNFPTPQILLVHIYMCIRTYVHIHEYTCMYVYIHTYVYLCITYIYTYVYLCITYIRNKHTNIMYILLIYTISTHTHTHKTQAIRCGRSPSRLLLQHDDQRTTTVPKVFQRPMGNFLC